MFLSIGTEKQQEVRKTIIERQDGKENVLGGSASVFLIRSLTDSDQYFGAQIEEFSSRMAYR